MMKLTDLTLLALQTAFMQRDLTTQGMCAGVQEQLRNAASKTYNILMYQTLDTMQDSEFAHQLADELAWQFHVDYYDKSADIETKKRLVKQSLKLHRTKGTPQAVIDLMEAVFSSKSELNEWFDYGGEPYHFRIRASSLLASKATEFTKALKTVKNTRSVFDGVDFFEIILANAVSKIKKNNTVRYTDNPVGFFDEYTFPNGEAFSFGVNEKAYSFITNITDIKGGE